MSRIKRLVRPEVQAINWKTAVTVIGVAAAFLGVAVHAAVPLVDDMVRNDEQVAASHETSSKPKTDLTVEVQGTVIRRNTVVGSSAKKLPETIRAARIDFTKDGCKVDYPREALRKEWTGTTALVIEISAEGKITKVKIADSSGHEVLDNAVRNQLLSGKCIQKPASINGVPQATTTQVKYVWEIDDGKPKKDTGSTPVSVEQALNRKAKIDFTAPECTPTYPRASLRNSEQGRTEINLKVSDAGVISGVAVTHSSGFRNLDAAIFERMRQSLCVAVPALKNGLPVASDLSIAYVWKIN